MDDRADGSGSTLTVVNAWPELERASTWLGKVCMSAGLSKDLTGRLQVALDEVLSNVMAHALADAPEGLREMGLSIRIWAEDRVELEVTDDGPAFDPTGVAPAPRAIRVAGRREGGAGLLFVRSLMDEVRFCRRAGRNCLTLCKRLEGAA
jgi:serine/threonine-protein kinase RsbW